MRYLLAAALLAPATAWAIDPVDPNEPLAACPPNAEVFYPRGDAWAFLPGGECADPAAEPVLNDDKLGAPSGNVDSLIDKPGHCLWVAFDTQGPRCVTDCPSDANEHAERARRTVFAAFRTWAGYNSGDSTFGAPDWYCPSPSVADGSTVARKTTGDYTFGLGASVTPSFNYFRAPNIPPTTTVDGKSGPNRGDTQECWTECVPELGNCSGLQAFSPQTNPPRFKCPADLKDTSKLSFRFTKARNNVVWVRGSGKWSELGYAPLTLAVTETLYWPDSGVAITSDMLFNNETINWHFGNPDMPGGSRVGCQETEMTPVGGGQSTESCFDLGHVATHEAGHFIGFGHISCEGSVMFRSANYSDEVLDLTKHEMAGVCSLYRPAAGTRYPGPKSRENEGCFSDSDCSGTGMKCLFSKSSFYKDAAALAAEANVAIRMNHRGVCVQAEQCTTNADCDTAHGRVCSSYDAFGLERYCLPGSSVRPTLPPPNADDFCFPCNEDADCIHGQCESVSRLGITLTGADRPAKICTAQCNIRLGCGNGYACNQVEAEAYCVPNNPTQCVASASTNLIPIESSCKVEGSRCAQGLICFDMVSEKVCLQRCSSETACETGYGCVLPLGVTNQSAPGACFKTTMKEGDNCATPSTALCGLDCSGGPLCTPNLERLCGVPMGDTAEEAKCHTLCHPGAMPTECKAGGQTCVAIPGQTDAQGKPLGFCNPAAGGICTRDVGEACGTDADCTSGNCYAFGGVSTCTKSCTVMPQSGCPKDTQCVADAGAQLCKPLSAPLASVCGAARSPGCGCGSSATPSELALLLAGVLFLALRRRKRA